MADDEERAAEYRRKMLARSRNILVREQAMRGSTTAKLALDAKWGAVFPYEWDPPINEAEVIDNLPEL